MTVLNPPLTRSRDRKVPNQSRIRQGLMKMAAIAGYVGVPSTTAVLSLLVFSMLPALNIWSQEISRRPIDNPYLRSEVGDWIEMKRTIPLPSGATHVTERRTVTEKTDSKVVVTYENTGDGKTKQSYVQTIDLTKPFTTLTLLTYPEDGPAFRIADTAEETIRVKGRPIQTTRTTYMIESPGRRPTKKVVWRSESVPVGGFVKSVQASSFGGPSRVELADFGFADPKKNTSDNDPPAGGTLNEPKPWVNSIGIKLQPIPGGAFRMGGMPRTDFLREAMGKSLEDRLDLLMQTPPHRSVVIENPFYAAAHELTIGQFRDFVEATGYITDAEKDGQGGTGLKPDGSWGTSPEFSWKNYGFAVTEDTAVANVSWNDAVAFCKWLGKQENHTYRLLSDQEWEYCCRAKTQTVFFTGDTQRSLDGFANMADQSLAKVTPELPWALEHDDGYAYLAPVGKFKANAFGLHDMHGNVLEWCGSEFSALDAMPELDAPTPPRKQYALRGGHFFGEIKRAGAACRSGAPPSHRMSLIGFRIATGSRSTAKVSDASGASKASATSDCVADSTPSSQQADSGKAKLPTADKATSKQFTMIDLGTLGGDNSEARAVNSGGTVVGMSENASGEQRAFIWESSTMTEIPAREANDINDDGIVVGLIKQGVDVFGRAESQAFRWSRRDGMETNMLPKINVGLSPKKLTGHARAINENGDIAMIGQGIAMYAILRRANGQAEDLGHLGSSVSMAYDINDRGEVVGYTKIGRTTVHGFLFRNGTMIDIGSLGGESGAHGINNKSEIVGSSRDSLARFRAFLWEDGNMNDLGTLGGQDSNARAINDRSWIIGNAQTEDGSQHGFLYRDGKMVDLNTLIDRRDGWVITDAFRLNQKGQIAAVAQRNGLKHAVLLSPVSLRFGADKKSAKADRDSADAIAKTTERANEKMPPNSAAKSSEASTERQSESGVASSENSAIRDSEHSPVVKFLKAESGLTPVAMQSQLSVAGRAPNGFKPIDSFATASPDFTRLAFTAERDDKKRRRAVIDGQAHPEYLIVNDMKFSPDSERVAYFAHEAGSNRKVLYVDGKVRTVTGTNNSLQFTPDSKHVLYVTNREMVTQRQGRSQWMEAPGGIVWDYQPKRTYGMMRTIRVGGDSKTVAFTAINNGRPIVVVGDRTIGTYSKLPGFPFSPPPVLSPNGKRHAFVASRGQGWFTVVDGRESSRTFREVAGLTFSPDSKHYAFIAESAGQGRFYVDGEPIGPAAKRMIGRPEYSPDSQRTAIGVSLQNGAAVMIDGKLQPKGDMISSAQFSPDSRSWVYGVKRDGKHFLVCNGDSSAPIDDYVVKFVFSPDCSKLAYIEKVGNQKAGGTQVLHVNSAEIDQAEEFDSSSLMFSEDSSLLAYWALRDGKWDLSVNGIRSGTSFDSIVSAEPQTLDINSYRAPSLCFADDHTVLAIGKDSRGVFKHVRVTLNPDQIAKPGEKMDLVEHAVMTRDADLKDGKKTIGKAKMGYRFRIESRQGNWLLGSFPIDGKQVRCWVSIRDAKEQ